MKNRINNKGFSLVEILMSLGILSIGMLLIAAVFPVGIHFTTIATERTIASAVADEAFAKIRLYCTDPNVGLSPGMVDTVLEVFPPVDPSLLIDYNSVEFSYPSDDDVAVSRRMYSWSAVWRRVSADMSDTRIQVTVFVSRRAGAPARYYEADLSEDGQWPLPLPVEVTNSGNQRQINISETSPDSPKRNFINPGCTIVDGRDGRIYRVRDRRMVGSTSVIVLDSDWPLSQTTGTVWVVAPPVGGGRYPCIAVYQKVIRF